jgi:hypothetical protein
MADAAAQWDGRERRAPARRLPETEIEAIAARAAKSAIEEFLEIVGVDGRSVEGRRRFRDDLAWLATFREGTQQMKRKIAGAGVTVLVSGALYALWHGLTHK